MKRPQLISAVAGLVVAALALFLAPDPRRLGMSRSGDPALADRVDAVLGEDTEGYDALEVAFIDGAQTTTATLGAPSGPLFEIGSTAKTFTGMLFASMVADGTVRPDETLGQALPAVRFADEATASITLEELASQRSGLPRLSGSSFSTAIAALRANPYAGQDVDALLDAAAQEAPDESRGQVGYSNFGMALLGQALAAKAGMPYEQLVTSRIHGPLGMSSTTVSGAAPSADLATGFKATGRPTAAWVSTGYAPAGIGPRSTAADLAKLVAATMAGTAPGATAAAPRFGDDGRRIGYAWFTSRYGDREITWHNGATGGFTAYAAFDRSANRGVVVLGNTDRRVEWIGLRLLGADAAPPAAAPVMSTITVILLAWSAVVLPVLASTPPGGKRWWRSSPDRLRVIGAGVSTIASLLIARELGAWLTVPPLLWAIAAGFAAAGGAALALRWGSLPTRADGRPWVRWLGLGVSAALSLTVTTAVVI